MILQFMLLVTSFKIHLDRISMAAMGRGKGTIVVGVRDKDQAQDRRGAGDVDLPSFNKTIVEAVQGLPQQI